MTKSSLIDEINAFAAARASGNPLLIQRQAQMLESAMSKLPEELPEVMTPEVESPAP